MVWYGGWVYVPNREIICLRCFFLGGFGAGCEGRYGISTSLIANNCLYTAQNIYYTCLNAPTFHPSKVYLFPSESECQSESKNRVRIEIRIRIQIRIRIRIRPTYLEQPNPTQTKHQRESGETQLGAETPR